MSSHRHYLFEFIIKSFGPNKYESEKEFGKYLSQKGTINFHVITNFILTCFVVFSCGSIWSLINSFKYFQCRCEIGPLEDNFTYEEIISLSVNPNATIHKEHCSYLDLNYASLVKECGYNYTKILEKVKTVKSVKTRPCERYKKIFIHPNMRQVSGKLDWSYKGYYSFYCTNAEVLHLMYQVGEIVCNIPLGVVCDLYGRKKGLFAACTLFIIGLFIMFIPHQIAAAVGFFFLSNITMVWVITYVLFVEMCNFTTKKYLGFLPLSFIELSTYFVDKAFATVYVWPLRLIAAVAFASIPVFVAFFVDESIRWMFFCNKSERETAWQLVTNKKLPSELFPDRKITLKSHLAFYTKVIFKTRMIKFVVIFLVSTPTSNFEYVLHSPAIYNLSHDNIITKGYLGFFLFILVHLGLFYIKRDTICMSIFFFLSFLSSHILVQNIRTDWAIGKTFLPLILVFYNLVIFITILRVSEMFPVSKRLTALGMCLMCKGCSYVISFLVIYLVDEKLDVFRFMLFVCVAVAWTACAFLPDPMIGELPDVPYEALENT